VCSSKYLDCSNIEFLYLIKYLTLISTLLPDLHCLCSSSKLFYTGSYFLCFKHFLALQPLVTAQLHKI
jgi:hypothetical protein